uniref:Uncharacterized protein n=1 Tax=Neolamprologus brichardi TaxID=32507 RepID=A0A3Q4I0M1_NEOBR
MIHNVLLFCIFNDIESFCSSIPYCPSLHVCLFLVCLNLCQIVVGYPTFSLAYSFLILRHFFPAISVQRFASFNLSDFLTPSSALWFSVSLWVEQCLQHD